VRIWKLYEKKTKRSLKNYVVTVLEYYLIASEIFPSACIFSAVVSTRERIVVLV
jgi:hypothetical protein